MRWANCSYLPFVNGLPDPRLACLARLIAIWCWDGPLANRFAASESCCWESLGGSARTSDIACRLMLHLENIFLHLHVHRTAHAGGVSRDANPKMMAKVTALRNQTNTDRTNSSATPLGTL